LKIGKPHNDQTIATLSHQQTDINTVPQLMCFSNNR